MIQKRKLMEREREATEEIVPIHPEKCSVSCQTKNLKLSVFTDDVLLLLFQ